VSTGRAMAEGGRLKAVEVASRKSAMAVGNKCSGKVGEGRSRSVGMGLRKVLYHWVREVKVLGGFLGRAGFF
jgi:hypothetical protein